MSHRPEEPPYFVRKMDADFQKRWHAADLPTRERLEDEAYAEWDRKLGPPPLAPEPEMVEKIEFASVRLAEGIRPGEVRVDGQVIGALRDFAGGVIRDFSEGSAETFRQALRSAMQGENRDQNEAEGEARPQNRDEGEAGIDG